MFFILYVFEGNRLFMIIFHSQDHGWRTIYRLKIDGKNNIQVYIFLYRTLCTYVNIFVDHRQVAKY